MLFTKIKLPDVFIVVHPIGTVLGNAKYGEKMVFYQGVTVGSTHLGKYPEFQGENILYSNSSVVGDCRIKSNVIFGANSSLINTNVDESLTVIGSYPNNRFIQSKPIINQNIFIMNLKGKNVIVTGGSGLLGKEIIKSLCKYGANVMNIDKNSIDDKNIYFFQCDLTDENQVISCIDEIINKFSVIHALVNNAYPRTIDWGNKFEDIGVYTLLEKMLICN